MEAALKIIKRWVGRIDFENVMPIELYEKLVAWGRFTGHFEGWHVMIRIPIPHIARTQDPYCPDETFEAACDWVFQLYKIEGVGGGFDWRVFNFIREGSYIINRRGVCYE